jgi:hypothetical protein
MATKIITKTGSGAPTTSDVDRGELAVDLTNKQLYTNDGTDIIKLGSGSGEGQWSLASNGDDIYYNDGNVGIGTDDPRSSLHIKRSGTSGSPSTLIVQRDLGPGGIDGHAVEIRLAPTQYPNDIGMTARWSGIRAINRGSGNATDLSFLTNAPSADPVERMRISANGNVGIGEENPGRELHITNRGSGDVPAILIEAEESNLWIRSAGSAGYFPGGNGEGGTQIFSTNSKNFHIGINSNAYGAECNLIFVNGRSYDERMRIDNDGRVGIGGQPSRSTKEIEDDAVSTLAGWKAQIDDRLKAEPKADKKAVTLEITGHDKLPTKAELIKSLTERNIGGGDAKLQVAGDGYFSGTVNAGVTAIKDNRIYDTARNTGIIFDATRCVIPCDGAGASATGEISIGRAEWKFKDAYFSGNVNAENVICDQVRGTASGRAGLEFISSSRIVPVDNTGVITDGAANLGSTTGRFNNAYFSGIVRTGSGVTSETGAQIGPSVYSRNAVSDDTAANEVWRGYGADVITSRIRSNGNAYFGTVYANGSPLTRNRDLIETLSTLRAATQDETTLEGLRDSIGNAIGGLIEKFEAMADAVEPARER